MNDSRARSHRALIITRLARGVLVASSLCGALAAGASGCTDEDAQPTLPGNVFECYPSGQFVCVDRHDVGVHPELAQQACYQECVVHGGLPSDCADESADVHVGESCNPTTDYGMGIAGVPPVGGGFTCPGEIEYQFKELGEWHDGVVTDVTVCGLVGGAPEVIHAQCVEQCEQAVLLVGEPYGPDDFELLDDCSTLGQPVSTGEECDYQMQSAPQPPPALVWNTPAGPQTLPLACNLNGDCCDAFGPLVCDAILAKAPPAASLAQKTVQASAKLTFAATGKKPISMTVAGSLRYSAPPCSNPNGACPIYLEQFQLAGAGPVSASWLHVAGGSTTFRASNVKVALGRPVLGAFRAATGQLQIPADAFELAVSADVQTSAGTHSMGTTWLHGSVVQGSLSSNGALAIGGTAALGGTMSVTFALTGSAAPLL